MLGMPDGTTGCTVVRSHSASAFDLVAQDTSAVTAAGPSEGLAYWRQPGTIAGLPSVTLWALAAGALIVTACIMQSLLTVFIAAVAVINAWSSASTMIAYATDPQHGGALNHVAWGSKLMNLVLVLLFVTVVPAAVQMAKIRNKVRAERKAQGLPASPLAEMFGAALAKGAQAASQSPEPAKQN